MLFQADVTTHRTPRGSCGGGRGPNTAEGTHLPWALIGKCHSKRVVMGLQGRCSPYGFGIFLQVPSGRL